MWLIINSFVVFAITLVITKSKILAAKREFVESRFASAMASDDKPGFVHKWWNAIWSCPMCCGFWMSIPVAFFFPAYCMVPDVLVLFGTNWLLHCIENALFQVGDFVEKINGQEIEKFFKKSD